jgi:uncharacterized membrane protein YdjX (TVP38/TMEM64 family)
MQILIHVLGWDLLSVFVSACLLYLIPFLGPSTMLYAGAVAGICSDQSPALIGIAVAGGASVAKAVHYYVSYFARRALSPERISRLEGYCERWGRWKSVATFVSSATPIPDEPVLVSLALVSYSPVRFLLAYFLGKIVITIPGAYLGRSATRALLHLVGHVPAMIVSIVFTIIVTVVLLKVDLDKLWRKVTRSQQPALSESR